MNDTTQEVGKEDEDQEEEEDGTTKVLRGRRGGKQG